MKLPRKPFAATHVRNARFIHLSIAMVVAGLIWLPFSWYWLAGSFLAFQFYWVCGLTVGWHRYFCHGAFKTNRFWEEVMVAAGCISLTGHPGAFSAVHLQHHRYADTEKDPHSKYKDVVFAATILSGIEVTNSMKKRFFLSPVMKRIHRYYFLYPLTAIAVLFAVGGPEAVVYLWALPVFCMQFMRKWVLVILPHSEKFGYRNFDTPDKSKNFWLLGVLLGGEGLHNNHHKKPKAWNFACRWWEFDPASIFVRMIKNG